MGTSFALAPSLVERGPSPELAQSLPRRVQISAAGWTALVGGWPELSLSLGFVVLVGAGAFGLGIQLGGLYTALLGAGGLALAILLALAYGAPDTLRTLRGYQLVRNGWGAAGEIARKLNRRTAIGVTYLIEYRYIDARGVRRTGRQEVTRDQWESLSAGDPVTVLFEPDQPDRSAIYELLGLTAVVTARQNTTRELPALESDCLEK